jgi:sigma-B regulation protein RsbU (phosphoserine phosphatase)
MAAGWDLKREGVLAIMGRRLLVVEDSPIMRRMISALLEDEGYTVDLANDGKQGLERARELVPELILSDYEMPEMDGPTLCQALKADEQLRSIPVIMLTSLGQTESKVIGLDAGADDYIQKPQSPNEVQEVFARIRAQLRIADLRRELAERNQQLEAAQAKLHHELELARKVQFALMPGAPRPRGPIRFAVRYKPAATLGGDVYDFTRLEDGRLAVLMADISGHGVNTALLSGVVKTLAAPLSTQGLPPAQFLPALDVALSRYFPESFFCTAFYLILDEQTGAFDYAGVGHPQALVVGPNGPRQLESDAGLLGMELLSEGDVVGGVDRLVPGESLLLYTDGLPDVMDPSGTSIGTDRIHALLGAHASEAPDEILSHLEDAVASHVAPGHPHDDINLILIQYPSA